MNIAHRHSASIQSHTSQKESSPQRDLKSLLLGSSPKNPTYILAAVLADFTRQSSTELTVKKGDEIYVMYEIDDWAYVACLTETTRRGYIPIDYCLAIQDFFYTNPSLNRQIQQSRNKEKVKKPSNVHHAKPYRLPGVPLQPSRKNIEPIEGSEMPAISPAAVERVHGKMYHSTDTLMAAKPLESSLQPKSKLKNGQRGVLRRSNTIGSTPKPTVTFHPKISHTGHTAVKNGKLANPNGITTVDDSKTNNQMTVTNRAEDSHRHSTRGGGGGKTTNQLQPTQTSISKTTNQWHTLPIRNSKTTNRAGFNSTNVSKSTNQMVYSAATNNGKTAADIYYKNGRVTGQNNTTANTVQTSNHNHSTVVINGTTPNPIPHGTLINGQRADDPATKRREIPTIYGKQTPATSAEYQQPRSSSVRQSSERSLANTNPTDSNNVQSPKTSINIKGKKSWGQHIKHRENYTELGEHTKRLSLSLETVDETSELEDSLNSSLGTSVIGANSNSGIQRLIAKFQTKIEEVNREVMPTTPRLSSVDSALSSLSEDNDSVFTDNEESIYGSQHLDNNLRQSNSVNSSKIKTGNVCKATFSNTLSIAETIAPSLQNNLGSSEVLPTPLEIGESKEPLLHSEMVVPNGLNGSSDVGGFSKNELGTSYNIKTDEDGEKEEIEPVAESSLETLHLELIEQPESLTESSITDTFEDSLLEPPISFSSPSLSVSSTDVPYDPQPVKHCSCCVHCKQSIKSDANSEVNLFLATNITTTTDPLPATVSIDIRTEAEMSNNIEAEKIEDSTQTTDGQPLKCDTSNDTILKKISMCDGATQTTRSNEDLTDISHQQLSIKDNSDKSSTVQATQCNIVVDSDPVVTRQSSSAFSRNAKLRQSRLCPETQQPEYLMQPISPASITDEKLPDVQDECTKRSIQQYSVML